MPDGSSLDNLRDIAEPVPVSWWPLAPGWWVVIAVTAVTLLAFGYRAWQRWKANAYRRAALAELQSAASDADVAEILKRTALSAFPRTNVTSLTGAEWCRWLSDTGGTDVPDIASQRLTAGVFRDGSSRTRELIEFAKRWINDHKNQEC